MRLLDRIAQSRWSKAVTAVPLRYVLDEGASRECVRHLVFENGMLDPSNELLRIPAARLWVERVNVGVGPELHTQGWTQRVGALVEAEPSGRQGSLLSFWEDRDGNAVKGQMRIHFDLDRPISHNADRRRSFEFLNRESAALAELFRHMLFEVEEEWIGAFATCSRQRFPHDVRACVQSSWTDLPLVLVLSLLLAHGSAMRRTASDLARLNHARAKKGRPALLDHIEVSRNMGAYALLANASRTGAVRSGPRLHVVRGHMVRRAGRTFWRCTHLRGDPANAIASRTVKLRGPNPASPCQVMSPTVAAQ